MNRWAICLFINLFVCLATNSFSQQAADSLKVCNVPAKNVTGRLTYIAPAYNVSPNAEKGKPSIRAHTLPSNYYYNNLGFFCSKELQLEKVTKIPFRFRLGSVQYTDQMEGKNRAYKF
jgi:hypothetical protein